MFLNDNYASFLLVIKQTFGKTSESLKIFWKWLSLNFFLLTISFLTAKFDKCSLIYARIYFISPKSVLKNTWKFFNTKFQPQSKKKPSNRLPRRKNFSTFLQLSCSNSLLKESERPYSHQKCGKKKDDSRRLGRVTIKKKIAKKNHLQNTWIQR